MSVRVSRYPRMSQRLWRTIFAGALALSLLIGIGSAMNQAAAERVPPGGDTFQRVCRGLQDQIIALVDEYGNASDARRAEILHELHNLGTTWYQIGCGDIWGDPAVYALLPVPPKPISPPGADVLHPIYVGSDVMSQGW